MTRDKVTVKSDLLSDKCCCMMKNNRIFSITFTTWAFITARNEAGQGYVFTRVCDSVHRGRSRSLSRGSLAQGFSVLGFSFKGSLCPGVSVWGGLCQRDSPTLKSGQYTSYWNAFLLGPDLSSSFLQYNQIISRRSYLSVKL